MTMRIGCDLRPTARGAVATLIAAALLAVSFDPASALVRFGSHVFVGGHDFSHQSYDRNHRAVVHLYSRTPPHEGCAWHPGRGGGRVKICHLRRLGTPE